jgi:hypothetical protein
VELPEDFVFDWVEVFGSNSLSDISLQRDPGYQTSGDPRI